jgi:hypothetical protein
MSIGDLLPAVLSAWKPRRAMRPVDLPMTGRSKPRPVAARPDVCGLPRGVIAVAPETQAVLAAEDDFARNHFVELQMAVQPRLVAQIDAAEYRTCLRGLLRDAIGRASSGVLVTAMHQADGVEIAVLDDGTDLVPQPSAEAAQPGRDLPLPHGAALIARYEQGRGTTMLLRLPQPEGLLFHQAADAADDIAVSTGLC